MDLFEHARAQGDALRALEARAAELRALIAQHDHAYYVLDAPTIAEVARMLASYNLVSLPVVDQAHRLVGAVSVDDVLDYLLPEDWRSHDGDESTPHATSANPGARR